MLLVPAAKGERRHAWDGPEPLRPLSALGHAQAERLVDELAGHEADALLIGPTLRCRQTITPLATARAASPRTCPEFAEDAPPDKPLARILAEPAESVICCVPAAVVRALEPALEERGVHARRVRPGALDCQPEPDARLAVLDLGSTSFHLLVADVSRAGFIAPVERERVMLRLGAQIAGRGRGAIPPDLCEDAIRAARTLAQTARSAGAERILAVGTAALRDAKNGPKLAEAIAAQLGGPLRIVAGEEEARLIFRAFRRRVLLPPGLSLGLDLGGGSLELALGEGEELHFEATLPLGAARLTRELIAGDPMRKREIRAVADRVHELLDPLASALAEPATAIAAGGTARALGHLAAGLRGLQRAASVNHLELSIDELRSVTEVLIRATHAERLALPGIRRGRADLLPTGALVLLRVAETLGLDGYTLCDWGLREGVLLEAVSRS